MPWLYRYRTKALRSSDQSKPIYYRSTNSRNTGMVVLILLPQVLQSGVRLGWYCALRVAVQLRIVNLKDPAPFEASSKQVHPLAGSLTVVVLLL